MFRLWAKIFKENHLIRDMVVCNDTAGLSRTQKVFDAVEEVCSTFDLAKPIWLKSTIAEFKKMDKTRFTQDNFMEHIEFDFLEIHVIEED